MQGVNAYFVHAAGLPGTNNAHSPPHSLAPRVILGMSHVEGVRMKVARKLLFIYVVAIINILSTLLPIWPLRFHLLSRGIPVSLILWAQHVTLFMGVAMLLLAFPAAHLQRRASQWLAVCVAIALIGNVLKGLDIEEAFANAALLIALWRSRSTLADLPLRYSVVDLARLAVTLFIFAQAYRLLGGFILIQLHHIAQHQPMAYSASEWIEHILTGKLPLQKAWFRQANLLLPLFLIGLFIAISWTSLIQAFDARDDRPDAYALFGRASHNSLAYLARRDDVATFYDAAGHGAVSYRLVGRIALQIGAILAPPEHREAVYRSFLAWCRTQRLIPAAVALAEDELPVVRRCGMRCVAIGGEAIVDLTNFSIEKLGKKMRWAHRSLSKRGLICTLMPTSDVSPALHAALDHIDSEWQVARGGQQHGYCMTLGRFPTADDRGCLVAVVRDETSRAVAYATFLPGGDGLYSLDLTRRSHDAPNATMEYLLMDALGQLRDRGVAAASLNFSALSSLSEGRIGRLAHRLLSKPFQLGSLEAFNSKFQPRWVRRYAVMPSWAALPDVAVAIIALEGVDRMVINACSRQLRQFVAGHASHPRLVAGDRRQGIAA